jgi:hypothetical protein
MSTEKAETVLSASSAIPAVENVFTAEGAEYAEKEARPQRELTYSQSIARVMRQVGVCHHGRIHSRDRTEFRQTR